MNSTVDSPEDQEAAEVRQFLSELKDGLGLDSGDLAAIEEYLGADITVPVANELREETPAPEPEAAREDAQDKDETDLRMQIGKMSIPQKIKLALFGNSTCRSLLIRDPNKIVHLAVLKNAKLQIGEIEDFARSTQVGEGVLRRIAAAQEWTRSYKVKCNLVSNPKTPPDVAMKWVKFLNATDLKRLAKSKNVSNVVSVAARKRLAEDQK